MQASAPIIKPEEILCIKACLQVYGAGAQTVGEQHVKCKAFCGS